jgi:hypothetical protein
LRTARIILTEGKVMDLHEMAEQLRMAKAEAEAYAEENVRLRIVIREMLDSLIKYQQQLRKIIDEMDRRKH